MNRIMRVLCVWLMSAGLTYAQVTTVQPAGVSGLSSSGTAITSTVPLLLPDGTAAAPSLSFTSNTDTGVFYSTINSRLNLSHNNAAYISLGSGLYVAGSGGFMAFTSGDALSGTADTFLQRDAANTLALRNSTNAQAFNIYNTADGSPGTNYERLMLWWGSNTAQIERPGGEWNS